jgi:Caspase domain
MAVNTHDRAVVIGISRYADAETEPAWITNLNGPDLDAEAVASWLRRPDGGGLPDENVSLIRSADFPDPTNIGPQQQRILDEFAALRDLPRNAYEGQFTGRRLYLYVSGHGMAERREDAAVITAEAKRAKVLNVLVTSWFEWFGDAARFQELVLWVDTCATRDASGLLTRCDWDREVRPDSDKVRRFYAFAAGLGKTAVENEIQGEWHGVFTYALLKGLDGALGTPVKSSDLRAFVHNSLTTFMTDKQRIDSRIGHEPVFGTTDDLVFAEPLRPPSFSVTLEFPADCVGKRATISVDAASPLVAETTLERPSWQVRLEAGGYAAFVPELDRAYPFGVTGGGSDEVVTLR